MSLITEKSLCRCELYKSSPDRRNLGILGKKDADVLFLLSCKYSVTELKLFFSFLKDSGYTKENSAFMYALGCVPKGYEIVNSANSFIKCKKANIKEKIEQIKPKVIVTEGLALHTIVENTYMKYFHFYNYLLLPTYFYSPEFNCWAVPISALKDFINFGRKKKDELKILDNFPEWFSRRQLKVIVPKRLKVSMRRSKYNCVYIENPKEFLKKLINDKTIHKVAVDIETTGFIYFKHDIICIQLCYDGVNGYFLEWSDDIEFIKLLNDFLKDKYLLLANFKFDKKFLKYNGVTDVKIGYDVNYAGHFVYSNRGNSLKALSYYFLDIGGYDNELDAYKKKYKIENYKYIPKDMLKDYACMDVIATYRLEPILDKLMNENLRVLFKETYLPLADLFVDMEMYGLPVDIEYIRIYKKNCEEKIQELVSIVQKKFPNINLASDEQVGKMFKKLGATNYWEKEGLSKKGNFLTGEDRLLRWKEDGVKYVDEVLKFRHLSVLVKTYLTEDAKILENYNEKTKRVHPSFNFQRNYVGRLSCNFQTLPIKSDKDFRPMFKAPEGYYIGEVDYAGFHLRLIAMVSGDKVLRKIFTSDMKDMHSMTASSIFTNYTIKEFLDKRKNGDEVEQKQLTIYRDLAKIINFSAIYNISYVELAHKILMKPPPDGWEIGRVNTYLEQNNIVNIISFLGIPSKSYSSNTQTTQRYEACAKSILVKFFEKYTGIWAWIEKMRKQGKKNGYVDSFYGFRMWLPEYKYSQTEGRESIISKLKNVSVNGQIIGSESSIIQKAQLQINEYFKKNNLDAHMINQVHDSLLFLFKKELLNVIGPVIKNIMTEDRPEYKGIPIDVSGGYGVCWKEYDRMPWKEWESASSI